MDPAISIISVRKIFRHRCRMACITVRRAGELGWVPSMDLQADWIRSDRSHDQYECMTPIDTIRPDSRPWIGVSEVWACCLLWTYYKGLRPHNIKKDADLLPCKLLTALLSRSQALDHGAWKCSISQCAAFKCSRVGPTPLHIYMSSDVVVLDLVMWTCQKNDSRVCRRQPLDSTCGVAPQ